MNRRENNFLIAASGCCFLAAFAHLGCIVFGADWYRMLGGGEAMAQMAEQGLWYPTLITLTIAAMLCVWGTFALAGAGVIKKLPFTRCILVVITSVFLLRAFSFSALMPMFPGNSLTFWLVSSGICLFIGSLFAVGTKREWSRLTQANV
ncbi:hypothetical protein [Vibrio ouci]|uniref:DUF3995 domain-containing protein n=1 Tax=Vibrio ouci TaxID=2499078 RepID=A0A4Y8W9K6_9VIBR|nr:hypothetical protein [Vibrio ouci]TFH89326.1 hypothetical protein ELS82_22865 [Vibrio ouci]